MIDLDKLEAAREKATRDKADLFDFYHENWDTIVDALKHPEIKVPKAFVIFSKVGNREIFHTVVFNRAGVVPAMEAAWNALDSRQAMPSATDVDCSLAARRRGDYSVWAELHTPKETT